LNQTTKNYDIDIKSKTTPFLLSFATHRPSIAVGLEEREINA
jgi:hypothetical protein